jgi:hypothetical protein
MESVPAGMDFSGGHIYIDIFREEGLRNLQDEDS